jgi:hypothetical protein
VGEVWQGCGLGGYFGGGLQLFCGGVWLAGVVKMCYSELGPEVLHRN